MMNAHEQRMCELQADFFELSLERFSCGSEVFVFRFMHSDFAKDLDKIDDCYNFISPNNLISLMKEKYESLSITKGEKYPALVMRWIGYIYRAYCIINKTSSNRVYKDLKAETLLSLFNSFHTFSPEYCVERLKEIVDQDKKDTRTDYEIYKAIMEEN